MKYIFVTYILLVAVSLQAQNKKMVLESGRTYYVYTCPDAPKVVTHAADELSSLKYLKFHVFDILLHWIDLKC